MQLYLNTSSPYARVVRVCLYEKELMERTELCWCDPWAADSELLKILLSRILALVTEGGEVLTKSLLIAHYLDAVGEGISCYWRIVCRSWRWRGWGGA